MQGKQELYVPISHSLYFKIHTSGILPTCTENNKSNPAQQIYITCME